MVPVSFLYDDMCRNNECRVFFVHDCTLRSGKVKYTSNAPINNHGEEEKKNPWIFMDAKGKQCPCPTHTAEHIFIIFFNQG